MTHSISFTSCSLPISEAMQQALSNIIVQHDQRESHAVTINFRDRHYNAEDGGFYPVEIALIQTDNQQWTIRYITDFAYMGNHYPELERNVDFDIANSQLFLTGVGWQPLNSDSVREFYIMWESNFLAYLEIQSYDEISLSS